MQIAEKRSSTVVDRPHRAQIAEVPWTSSAWSLTILIGHRSRRLNGQEGGGQVIGPMSLTRPQCLRSAIGAGLSPDGLRTFVEGRLLRY